eukprot:904652-Pyramimonas_sp.AAC.1
MIGSSSRNMLFALPRLALDGRGRVGSRGGAHPVRVVLQEGSESRRVGGDGGAPPPANDGAPQPAKSGGGGQAVKGRERRW